MYQVRSTGLAHIHGFHHVFELVAMSRTKVPVIVYMQSQACSMSKGLRLASKCLQLHLVCSFLGPANDKNLKLPILCQTLPHLNYWPKDSDEWITQNF